MMYINDTYDTDYDDGIINNIVFKQFRKSPNGLGYVYYSFFYMGLF